MQHAALSMPVRPSALRNMKPAEHLLRLVRSSRPLPHGPAATRFAVACAAIGGVTMLSDLEPDVVTVSFGSRTRRIWECLHQRGWTFVGKGMWKNEPVLGVSFSGDRRANKSADELAEVLIEIVREIESVEPLRR